MSEGSSLWRTGATARVFLSHVATERGFVGEVSGQLAEIGLSAFVAHDSIEPSSVWQDTIEEALRTADVLVGLLHPGFNASPWAQQEVGWALGREIPVLMVRLGEDPKGFPARWQASRGGGTPWEVAGQIAVWLSTNASFGQSVTVSLVREVREANSFTDAKAAALRVEQVGRLKRRAPRCADRCLSFQ